jgi:hypothetical protein
MAQCIERVSVDGNRNVAFAILIAGRAHVITFMYVRLLSRIQLFGAPELELPYGYRPPTFGLLHAVLVPPILYALAASLDT